MKTIFTIIAFGMSINIINAQKIKESEVPAPVKESFSKQYPAAKVDEWEKEGNNYEAEFKVNDIENAAAYTATGELNQIEMAIDVAEVPKAIIDYVNTNMEGKKIKEASKIVDPTGNVSYEVEVGNIDYLFNAGGKLIEKEVEKDIDDDKK